VFKKRLCGSICHQQFLQHADVDGKTYYGSLKNGNRHLFQGEGQAAFTDIQRKTLRNEHFVQPELFSEGQGASM
jgi:hypothetical protein